MFFYVSILRAINLDGLYNISSEQERNFVMTSYDISSVFLMRNSGSDDQNLQFKSNEDGTYMIMFNNGKYLCMTQGVSNVARTCTSTDVRTRWMIRKADGNSYAIKALGLCLSTAQNFRSIGDYTLTGSPCLNTASQNFILSRIADDDTISQNFKKTRSNYEDAINMIDKIESEAKDCEHNKSRELRQNSEPEPIARPEPEPIARPVYKSIARSGPEPITRPAFEPIGNVEHEPFARPEVEPISRPEPEVVERSAPEPPVANTATRSGQCPDLVWRFRVENKPL